MHSVKRTRISSEAQAAKRKEDADKITQYRALVDQCLNKKDTKEYSEEALRLTNQILDFNPEFYTIWNYRRLILLRGLFPSSSPEERFQLLSQELRLTFAYLHIHPKVYWIWTHRKWCLENIPEGPGKKDADADSTVTVDHMAGYEGWRNQTWGRELMIVEKMMDADARNFHAWDYRRYVLSSLPTTFKPARTLQTEIKFTTSKIESNFSNFSAWHQRTKVLEKMWQAAGKEDKGKEFELVTQALWTDPGDQSGWLYHRWLVGDGSDRDTLTREIGMIRELLEAEPDAKWPLESLVHYCTLLANRPETTTSEKQKLDVDIKDWLVSLARIDPYRKARYDDLINE